MYNNYDNSPNLMIAIGSVVFSQQKNSSIKLPNFFKACSCSLVNSQTHFDDVSMYLKFGHKSVTLSKNFTLIFSYKGQSTIKCFSSSISPLEQFVHFLSDLIMFLYLPVSIFNE